MLDDKLFDTKQDYPTYSATPQEQKRLGWVKDRISAMQQARTVVDKDWGLYQQMIDAIWIPYPDERSSSTVPLASSIIELAVAEATKIKTDFNFVPESSKDQANTRAFDYVWKHLWRKNNRDRPINKAEYICFGFGDVPLYVGYESYSKVQSDAIVDPETGAVSWKENEIKKDGIILQVGDIRQFYMDNQAIDGIDDADDCAYRQWISYDQFKELESNPLYKNIDKVQPRGYSNDWKTFITQEEGIKVGNYVERWFYWNVRKDCYIEIANDVEVREHPMMSTIDGEKALPWVWRGLGYKTYSIYHRGICEALMMFNSEINNLREMLMDSVRRSNSQVLAIGNGLKFKGGKFSYENQILTFDGKLGQENFQQITGTPPNQAIFNYIDKIYKDISVFIGIDIQNVMGEPDLTAYQTEVKRESSMKRMNVWLYNRDIAYHRLACLLKDQILTWFPQKDADGMYPVLETEDVDIQQTPKGQPDKIKKKKGTNEFQVTPEILRNGKRLIEANTNTSAPTIGAVDREQKSKFLQDVGNIANSRLLAQQAGINLDSIVNLKEDLKDLAEQYGLTPIDNTGNNEEVKAAQDKLMKGLMNMKQMMGGQQPQQPGQPPQGQPAQGPGGTQLPQAPALQSNQPPQGQPQPQGML